MTNHIPASQRQIRSLQSRVAELELMQHEYNALLNYLVVVHGEQAQEGDEKIFVIESSKMKAIKLLPIRSEITFDGKKMFVKRIVGEQPSIVIE